MLKYEEKLHLGRRGRRPGGLPQKIVGALCGIAGYILLYFLFQPLLAVIPDVRPWAGLAAWFSFGRAAFVKTDAAYFACGLILSVYGTLKLVQVTAENHASRSKGSDVPERLLTAGSYARARHPMYAAFIVLQSGFLLSLRSLDCLFLALVLAVFQYGNAYFEEKKVLVPAFGKEYALYRKNVKGMALTKAESAALASLTFFSLAGLIL